MATLAEDKKSQTTRWSSQARWNVVTAALLVTVFLLVCFWIARRSVISSLPLLDLASRPSAKGQGSSGGVLLSPRSTAPLGNEGEERSKWNTPAVQGRTLSPQIPSTVSPKLQDLLRRITNLDLSEGKISQAGVRDWKDAFNNIVRGGGASVPAITEFLARNSDLSLNQGGADTALGYSTVRQALLDALHLIGGADATQALVDTLRSTGDLNEINRISLYLEEEAPGQYRAEVVGAARETLNEIAKGVISASEVGPLFKLIQNTGDSSVVPALVGSMPQWHYYATMALAGLPEGQGVNGLIERVQSSSGGGTIQNQFGVQMLAQVAAQYPEAASALIEEAKLQHISGLTWSNIADGLAGDQYVLGKPEEVPGQTPLYVTLPGLKTYHIESGNQNFYSVPFDPVASPQETQQRISIVDQLISVVKDPDGVRILQNARKQLARSPGM